MFRVGNLPEPIAPDRLARLVQCETATIGHFLHSGFMDPAITAVVPGRRVAGTAVTVLVPPLDGTINHYAVGHARRAASSLLSARATSATPVGAE